MRLRTLYRHLLSSFAIGAAAILSTSKGHADSRPGIPEGWSDGYVYSNGARLHYYHAKPATGKPVIVMIHGVTDIGLSWTTLTWELEDDFDIYMLDTRAHGLSDPFYASDDGDTLVKDVVGFIEAKGFEKPIFMGHSMGGATVIRLGAEYPDLASAIIVLDAGIRGPRRQNQEGRDEAPRRPPESRAPEGMSISMLGDPERLVAQNNYSYDDLLAKSRRDHPKWGEVDHQYWALSKIQYHGPYSEDAWQAMRGVMNTGDSLANITAPLLLLKADASPEVREAHQEAASVIQNGKLVHVDDSGHNLHHDQLERTTSEIKSFLASIEN